jgi:hypothetical protein
MLSPDLIALETSGESANHGASNHSILQNE